MKKINAIIERASDGTFSIYMDDNEMDYLITGTGNTAAEAIEDFKSGYQDMKKLFENKGKEFQEAEFVFKYDMASFLNYYSNIISLAGLARLTGVNQRQLSHYLTGRRRPSQQTVEKMQNCIHNFAKDLEAVRFI